MGRTNIIGGFEHVVLIAVLRLGDKGAYGISIMDEVAKQTGRRISNGAVYRTLEQLEKKGHLSSHLSEPEHVAGGRAKRLYRIEPKGWDALLISKQTLEQMWQGIDVEHVSRRLGTPSLKLKEAERATAKCKGARTEDRRSPRKI